MSDPTLYLSSLTRAALPMHPRRVLADVLPIGWTRADDWTRADVEAELVRMRAAGSLAAYLLVSRVGARRRLDRATRRDLYVAARARGLLGGAA